MMDFKNGMDGMDMGIEFSLQYTFECFLGVPVPSKWDWSLITWDRSQIFEFFGTRPIILLLNNLMEEIIYFGLICAF
jgi:hypothetical protein